MLEERQEWLYITVNATLKICMKLKGQENNRAAKKLRNAAPFGDDVAWRRLLSVRGRSGAVLLMHPLQSEKPEYVAQAFQENFTQVQSNMAQYWAIYMLSSKFFQDMRPTYPNLRAMGLDPVHLAVVHE